MLEELDEKCFLLFLGYFVFYFVDLIFYFSHFPLIVRVPFEVSGCGSNLFQQRLPPSAKRFKFNLDVSFTFPQKKKHTQKN